MAVQATGDEVMIGARAKGFPPELWGRSTAELEASQPPLSSFTTPIMAVALDALTHNERVAFDWARESGVRLAPHGKTTMAPVLWERLAGAGSWGLTLATPWQVQLARAAGVPRIMLANALVDAAAAAWIRDEMTRDPAFAFSCWADSEAAVWRLAAALESGDTTRPIDVMVELGGAHGRTGARTIDEGLRVAAAIVSAPALRLVGVAGYEGPFGSDRSAASVASVDAFLGTLGALFARLDESGCFEELRAGGGTPVVTAGGSSFPDRVVAVLGPAGSAPIAAGQAELVLRSGAFQIHDDGFYARMGPFGREVATEPLHSAMHVWARVLSRPEPGLALLDAGRRDVPYDIDLPVPQRVRGLDRDASDALLQGARISALNDQHAFLRLGAHASLGDLPVGSVVRLGLSHPCTAFDKWRLVPLIDSADADEPLVLGAVETWL